MQRRQVPFQPGLDYVVEDNRNLTFTERSNFMVVAETNEPDAGTPREEVQPTLPSPSILDLCIGEALERINLPSYEYLKHFGMKPRNQYRSYTDRPECFVLTQQGKTFGHFCEFPRCTTCGDQLAQGIPANEETANTKIRLIGIHHHCYLKNLVLLEDKGVVQYIANRMPYHASLKKILFEGFETPKPKPVETPKPKPVETPKSKPTPRHREVIVLEDDDEDQYAFLRNEGNRAAEAITLPEDRVVEGEGEKKKKGAAETQKKTIPPKTYENLIRESHDSQPVPISMNGTFSIVRGSTKSHGYPPLFTAEDKLDLPKFHRFTWFTQELIKVAGGN